MTASELKYNAKEAAPYFFDHKSMKFFGDTMKNYGVRSNTINTPTRKNIMVWELYRKKPVKCGNQSSTFFCKNPLK